MKVYTKTKFLKALDRADLVYGSVHLNAGTRVPVRLRKKTLVDYLNGLPAGAPQLENGIFAEETKSEKGLRVLRVP